VSLKTLFTLVAPGALVLTAAGVLLLAVPNAPALAQAARGYPTVALVVAALLAWRMHRSRLLLAALLLVVIHGLLHSRVLGGATVPTAATALFLPLVMAALALTTDRPRWTRHAVAQLLLVAVPAAALAGAVMMRPDAAEALLLAKLVDPIYTDWTGLDQLPLLAAVLAFHVLCAVALHRGKAADAGLAWATLAGVLALASTPAAPARGLWLLAAGTIMIIALVESSYMMAFHDELTGLPGRRALGQLLAAQRPPYTVAVVDIDHFKSFNDRHGHDVGDDVLRMVAGHLAAVKGGGRAFRSGGEEFTLVFPGRSRAESLAYVEEVRVAVEEARFTLRRKPRPPREEGERRRGRATSGEKRLSVTISVGLASAGGANTTTDAVVKAADKAMYRAKKNGRNRVVA
jgi:GGDEF domain-containing protein